MSAVLESHFPLEASVDDHLVDGEEEETGPDPDQGWCE
jgi:hypothetical protein